MLEKKCAPGAKVLAPRLGRVHSLGPVWWGRAGFLHAALRPPCAQPHGKRMNEDSANDKQEDTKLSDKRRQLLLLLGLISTRI